MRPRSKKLLADLWGNRTRTFLVVVSIAIGVFAVGMVANTYLYLDEATDAGYEAINPTSAFIMSAGFGDDLVDTIRHMTEVADAEGRRVRTVRLLLRGRWYSAELSALNYAESTVNLLEPIAGRPVPGDRQLLIDQSALALTGFALGETVLVEMGDGRQYEMPLVGSLRDQNSNPSINSGGINIYTTLDTFEWLGETADYNRLLYTAAANRKDADYIKALTGDISERMERSGVPVYFALVFAEPGVSPVKFLVQTIRSVLGILALVSLTLSAFLVYNTMSALLLRQVPYIGIMKAVGASRVDVMRHYLLLVAAFGMLAFTVAVPAALLAAMGFTHYLASPSLLDLPLTGSKLSPVVLGLQFVVSLLVPVAAALPAIMRGTRVSVQQALNTQGLTAEDLSGSLVERTVERIHFLTGPWILALGNILRNRRRAVLTLITLTLGGAVFVGVLSVNTSAARTVAQMGEAYRFDVQLDFEQPYRLALVKRLALAVPGVEAIEGWASASGTIIAANGEDGNSMTIQGPPANSSLTRPAIVAGRWLRPQDENALVVDTSLLREDPTLEVGDEILLRVANREETWTIVGVYQSLGVQVWYEAYANYDYVSRLVGDVDQSAHFKVVTTGHDPAYQDVVAGKLESVFRAQGLQLSAIETSTSLRRVLEDQFAIIVTVLLVMALLITLVGGLGLAGTMSMNVLERTREIGVLRALGATDGTVLGVVLLEGLLLAIASWLASLLLAWPVGKLLSMVVGTEIANGSLDFVYSAVGAFYWLMLVVFIAVAACAIPARNASRLTVRDVLAYE